MRKGIFLLVTLLCVLMLSGCRVEKLQSIKNYDEEQTSEQDYKAFNEEWKSTNRVFSSVEEAIDKVGDKWLLGKMFFDDKNISSSDVTIEHEQGAADVSGWNRIMASINYDSNESAYVFVVFHEEDTPLHDEPYDLHTLTKGTYGDINVEFYEEDEGSFKEGRFVYNGLFYYVSVKSDDAGELLDRLLQQMLTE